MVIEVGTLAFIESVVVDETDTPEGLSKIVCLLISGVEPVSVCPLLHLLALLTLDVLLDGLSGDAPSGTHIVAVCPQTG